MLLLNFVRALFALLGLLTLYTVQLAYALTGIPLIVVGVLLLFIFLAANDLTAAWLIAYFNKDETPRSKS